MPRSLEFKAVSHSTGSSNEDQAAHGASSGWLLDGATSISGRRKVIDGITETDASWFVKQFSDELHLREPLGNPIEAAKAALRSVRARASDEWGDWGLTDVPSASLACVTVSASDFHLVNLGDCRVLFQADDEPIASFGSCEVAALDRDLLARYLELRKSGACLDHAKAAAAVVPTIRSNRHLMNQVGGYWILSPDGAGLAHAQHMRVGYQRKARIMLMTDGLFRLVDTYGAYSAEALFERAFGRQGIEALVRELRHIERDDPRGEAFPRVKLQDDASALLVEVTG